MKIQALATCYNRVEKTLNAIKDLKSQQLPEGISLSITIVDDGSTDGTSKIVKEKYPDVEIVKGTGGLFWAGGMRYGWEKSIKNKEFDALLVFNDDIRLNQDAISILIDTYRSVSTIIIKNLYAVSGAFESSDKSEITYGGFKRSVKWYKLKFKMAIPNGKPQMLDTINMNLVLISKESLSAIGFLSAYFRHGGADKDFGLRLRDSSGILLLTPTVVGICDRNSIIGTSSEAGIGYLERIKRLISIKEQPPVQRFKYFKRHEGYLWFFLFLLPYIRVLFLGRIK